MNRTNMTTTCVLAAMILAAALAGCSAGPMQVAGAEASLPAKETSPGFLDRISAGPNVSENDAMRGLIMLLDGRDAAETFRQRINALLGRDVLDSTWDYDSARPITRGKLAYMIYQACEIPGGVMLTLTGPSQRYCLRELQYQGMMATGSQAGAVTGMEFVAVLNRADTYMRTGRVPEIISAGQE